MGLMQRRLDKHAHDCEVSYGLLETHPPDVEDLALIEVHRGHLDPVQLVAEGKALARCLRSGPGRDGAPMAADTPTQIVERAQDRCGLVQNPKPRPRTERARPLVTLQGLRHTAGSIMLAAGVPLIVVSRQLGHANPNITATVYAHLLEDSQLDAAAAAFEGRENAADDAVQKVEPLASNPRGEDVLTQDD